VILKNTHSKLKILTIVIISISFGILLPTSTGLSQSSLRIFDEIGGGGNTTTPQSDNSDNTTLYIVGAALIVGVVAYVIITKNKKKDEEEADTSSALNDFNTPVFASELNDFEHEVAKVKENFPVDFMVGIRNNKALVSDKTYLIGVSVRF